MMKPYSKAAIIAIVISTLFRIFWASQLEFGNDEVYYWLYAKYPDISHFDHPPFVGFFIQFFTFDLYFDSELAIRLAAIVPASVNMYLLFLIGKEIKDEKTGFISVLLYNLNIYGLLISGTFILPDAPMLFFWILSLYCLIKALPKAPSKNSVRKLLLGFFFIGCAIYSKYQAVFLLLGVVLYVMFFNREWLKNKVFYISFIFPSIAVFLIFYWNFQNDFISYKFHNDRVSLFSKSFNITYFLSEVSGQLLYSNPYIFVSIIVMLVAFYKKKYIIDKKVMYFFIFFSIPLILTTIYLSFFRKTLPHWSGVSYIILLPVLAFFLSDKNNLIKNLIKVNIAFIIILSLFTLEINKGLFLPVKKLEKIKRQGRNDVINDIYGWKQAEQKIKKILEENKLFNIPIISNNWYPASHIDYYIARPNNMNVYGKGDLSKIHKYYWINEQRETMNRSEALYITDSRNYKNPENLYCDDYRSIDLLERIPITRNNKIVKYIFLYTLSNS